MRIVIIFILSATCLTGCAGVRQHWADGFGKGMHHTYDGVRRHGPDFVVDAILGSDDGFDE